MKNNKLIIILIIVILLIVGGIIGYVVCSKGEKVDNNEVNRQAENTTNVITTENSVKEKVYQAEYSSNLEKTTYIDGFGKVQNVNDIKVPYINIESEDAKKANNEIKQLYYKLVNEFKTNQEFAEKNKGTEGFLTNEYEVKYQTYENDNVLSVVMTIITPMDVVYYYSYNFDLTTLKLMSFEEIYEKVGFTKENISSKVELAIRNNEYYTKNSENKDNEKYIQDSINAYREKSFANIKYVKVDGNDYLEKDKYMFAYYLDENKKLNIGVFLATSAGQGAISSVLEINN